MNASTTAPPDTYRIARAAFLLLLGLCLFGGFLALWHQAPGLIGSRGITPLTETLAAWRSATGSLAPLRAPSLFWLGSSDTCIATVTGLGLLASVLLLLGIAPRAACLAAYVAWLSFRSLEIGTVCWFNFPYDDLQAEAVFLGIAIAPPNLLLWRARNELPRWARWLVLWLLFRLLLGPGITKVLYHQPWLDLTAIGDFLLTMPHPTAATAVLAGSPQVVLAALCVFTLACELVCPFLLLVPGRPRRAAAAVCIALMLGIQLVCNIRGFNLLTIGLLALMWPDRALLQLVPAARRARLAKRWPGSAAATATAPRSRLHRVSQAAFAVAFVAVTLAASIGPTLVLCNAPIERVAPFAQPVAAALQPFRISSCYTMFCVMPTERFALVVQASDDGETWHDYEPLGAPAYVDRAPRLFAPYHDYLGFRLWFAAFCPPSEDDWLRGLQRRLLADEASVKRLFATVPLAGRAPQWVRMQWFRYQFADAAERQRGIYWRRQAIAVRIAAAQREQ